MSERARDRRRNDAGTRLPTPSSPVNLLILTVVTVIGATAAATAMLGSGYDNQTPHGRTLGDLERLAEAQERHHRATGEFALWLRTLDVEPSDGVQVTIVRADSTGWEALAVHSVGLTCSQGGAVEGDASYDRNPAGCYAP